MHVCRLSRIATCPQYRWMPNLMSVVQQPWHVCHHVMSFAQLAHSDEFWMLAQARRANREVVLRDQSRQLRAEIARLQVGPALVPSTPFATICTYLTGFSTASLQLSSLTCPQSTHSRTLLVLLSTPRTIHTEQKYVSMSVCMRCNLCSHKVGTAWRQIWQIWLG